MGTVDDADVTESEVEPMFRLADNNEDEDETGASYLGSSERPLASLVSLASLCKTSTSSRVSEADDADPDEGSEPRDTALVEDEESEDEEGCRVWRVSCQAWDDRSRSRRAFTPAGS